MLYNHLAFTYDLVAWVVSFGQWADWRRTALPHLQPGPTLELAYGTGDLYIDMSLAGLTPIGIDQSPFMARLATKKLGKRKLSGAILCAKAQDLPFPDNLFANIIATFPTDYIFEKKTLLEINRVLTTRPGTSGRLIIVVQGQLKGPPWLKAGVEWLYRLTGQRGTTLPDPLLLFKEAGLAAHWVISSFQSARASLIIAQSVQKQFN